MAPPRLRDVLSCIRALARPRPNPSSVAGLLVALCSTLWAGGLLDSETARAGSPPEGFAAVETCRTARCRSGLRALRAGRWERAADDLRTAAPGPGHRETARLTAFGAAFAEQRRGERVAAAHLYAQIASSGGALARYAAFRGVRALLAADRSGRRLLSHLIERGAFEDPFPDRAFVRLRADARLDRWSSTDHLAAALDGAGDRRAVCAWALDRIDERLPRSSARPAPGRPRIRGWLGELYARCPSAEDDRLIALGTRPGWTPSPTDRIRRAEALYGAVEYERARDVLSGRTFDGVETATACRGRFRRARTLARLDRSSGAAEAYRSVVDTCPPDRAADPRIRSLYALGTHHYDRGRHDRAAVRFRQILEEFPRRSHADDALLFLARIARQRGNRQREYEILQRAVSTYPDGDMVHELAWEVLERPFHRGDFQVYLDRLDDLDRLSPPEKPYEQGRLGYYRGYALAELGRVDRAHDVWRHVWQRYPLSFYGYLARLRLRDRSVPVENPLATSAPATPDWLVSPPSRWSSVARLQDLGLNGPAADLARSIVPSSTPARTGGHDRWRLAFSLDAAGRYHRSHEVVRRQIDGRPWVDPPPGRRTRWRIAFPEGFSDRIRGEVDDHADDGVAPVRPSLVFALVREESGFRPEIESWAGAVGLMQLMPATARRYAHRIEGDVDRAALETAASNVEIGTAHLVHLAERFEGHPAAMLAAYNAGAGAAGGWVAIHDRRPGPWVEAIPYRQTRHYTKRVLGSYAAYQLLADRPLDPRVGDALPAP